ncbi:MAG TPA: DNA gyrase C-terminal beta-propeller domain-containing protein, partial [Limnochordia bacterium]
RAQRRGGRGVTALNTREEDFVEHLFITTTHTFILFFTNRGRVYRLKAHEVPEAGRTARGMAIINLIQIDRDEQVTAAIPVSTYHDGRFLMMATRKGTIKKTSLGEFDSPRAGLIAIALEEDDELVGVHLTGGENEVLLVTEQGQAIRFPETEVRPMGRTAHGVKGISLEDGDRVIGMDCVAPDADLLVVTARGYGKRTPLEEYRVTRRGGKGIRTLHRTEKNGEVVGARVVRDEDELMLLSADGVMIRISMRDVPRLGRSTQGVRLMRLNGDAGVVAIAQIAAKDDDGDE